MNPESVFENALAESRNAVKVCVNEAAAIDDVAARVAKSHDRVNESKVALNQLRQAAAEYPEAAAEDRYKALTASSEKHLSACIEDYELSQAVLVDMKSKAKQTYELVSNGLKSLDELCLNDQHHTDVDALLAEITACKAALPT